MTREPELFGIRFCESGLGELAASLADTRSAGDALPLFTLNVAHLVRLRRDPAFRAAYRGAWRVTVDGMPIHLYARTKGLKIPRVTGSDLVAELFQTRHDAMRAFFVAASRETAQGIGERLAARGYLPGALAFEVPPFGFEHDMDYSRALAARIAAHRTTHLFMGVGAPKSEIWVVERRRDLGGCVTLCVGAGLDYLAGTRPRAPVLMQKAGFEWAWRLCCEPRRLGRRYLFDAFAFLAIVAFARLDLRDGDRTPN